MSDKVFRGGFITLTSIKDVATRANKTYVNTSFCKRPCDLCWVSMDCFTVNWYKKQDFKGFLQIFFKLIKQTCYVSEWPFTFFAKRCVFSKDV